MKVRERADRLRLLLQDSTALDLGRLQVVECLERAISHAFIRERPQAFTGLQFRRIRRQEEQVDALRNDEVRTAMPASSIQHQQDPFVLPGSHRPSKVRQRNRKHLHRHGWQQQPLRLSGNRMDKTVDVKPLVAVMDRDAWTGSFPHPDAAQDRFQTDAMLIGRPQFNGGLGEGLLQFFYLLRKFFLKAC